MSTAGSAHRPFGAPDGAGEIDLVSRRDDCLWPAFHAARPIRPFSVDELHGRTVTSPLRGGRNLRAQLRPSSEEVVHQCASKFRVGLIWSTYSPPPEIADALSTSPRGGGGITCRRLTHFLEFSTCVASSRRAL